MRAMLGSFVMALTLMLGVPPEAASQQLPGAPTPSARQGEWSSLDTPRDIEVGRALTWRWLPGLLSAPRPLAAPSMPENVAGLPRVISEGHTTLAVGRSSHDGEYRRPLAPGSLAQWRVAASGESPLGDAAAFIGRILFEQTHMDPGGHSILNDPYAASPFTLLDTLVTPSRHQTIRVEGAGARAVGPLHAGLALGFEARNAHSTLARIPRISRLSRPAATLGVDLPISRDGSLVVGMLARWAGESETLNIVPVSGATLVVRTLGYQAPDQVLLAPGLGFQYFRREVDERGLGATLAGRRGQWSWHALGERNRVHERVRRENRSDAPTEDWDAALTRVVAGIHVMDAAGALGFTARGEWVQVEGTGARAPNDSVARPVIYHADEQRVGLLLELRHAPLPSSWSMRGTLEVAEERRDRGDPEPALLRSSVRGRTWRAGGELAHRVHDEVRLAAGYWLSRYSADGAAPVPGAFPPTLRPWVGGELAHAASPTTGHTLTLVGDYRRTEQLRFQLAASWSSVTAREGAIRNPLRPSGSRGLWTVELRTLLR